MMEDLIDRGNSESGGMGTLPYPNAPLVLGIIAIVTFWLWAIPGIVCGILAIVFHNRNKAAYLTDPLRFEEAYKNSKAGSICGIIGLTLGVVYILALVGLVIFFAATLPGPSI